MTDDAYERLAARELEFEDQERPRIPNRLPDEGHVAGVAAGLSRRFDVDVRVLRLAFVVVTLLSGVGPLIYAGLWLAMKPEGSSTVSFRLRDVVLVVALALLFSVGLALLIV